MTELLAAALALAFWRVGLWSRGLPLLGHVFFLAQPLISQVSRQLQAGTLPLWNPYAYCGIPLLADPQAEVFNPVHVVFRLFPFGTAFRLNLAVDVVLACVFTTALLRRFGVRRSSAVLAGLLAACGGFFYYHSPMIAQEDAMAWIPAILLFWSGGAAVALGFALALCYLGGNPFFVSMALAAGLALRPPKRPWATAAVGGALALALAAPQLLPALELFSRSLRAGALSPAAALGYSVPPSALLRQLVVPLWNRSASAFVGDPTITSFYVGLPALALAVAGATARRAGRLSALCWAVGGLCLMLGAYAPLYPALLKVIPGLALFRFPAQWGAIAALGAAVLAAFGADRLPRRWRLAAILLTAADLWLFLGQAPTLRAREEFFRLKPATLAAASMGARVAHTAALLAAQAGAVPDGDPERYWLAQNEGLVPSRGTLFGLREVLSYNLYEPKASSRLIREALRADLRGRALLRYLGVGALIDGSPNGGYRLIKIDDPLPRLIWTDEPSGLSPAPGGRVEVVSELPSRLEARVQSSAPGYLSWSDTFFPGWRVFVDGGQREVLRANLGFRAVAVPPGEHDVRWRYRSRLFALGLALALGALLAAGLAVANMSRLCYS